MSTSDDVQPIISCKNIEKWYDGVHALKALDLDIYPNEVIGLVGDNGAGKSTLVKLLCGAHTPTTGSIFINGKLVSISSPKVAMQLGIETIYQYTAMVHTMSIARNLFIGREPLKFSIGGIGVLDKKKMEQDSKTAIDGVDLHLRSPNALVGQLSGGQRQGVAIARGMHFKSKVMILDEPTNHLSVKETKKVLEFVGSLKDQNMTGIFISHNMYHMFPICDRFVVMARGEVIADLKKEETSIDHLHELLDV